MSGDLNTDYPSGDERMRAVEQSIAVIGQKVDDLAHGAALVAERLEDGNKELGSLKTEVQVLSSRLEEHPDGLIAKVDRHESEIRSLQGDQSQRAGAREWWKTLLLLIAGGLVSLAVAFGGQAFQQQRNQVDALCAAKIRSLDTARERNAITQQHYDEQMDTLAKQGCTR